MVDEDVVVGLEQLTIAMEKSQLNGGFHEEVASEAGESDHGVVALSETGSDAGKSEHKAGSLAGSGCESDSERFEVSWNKGTLADTTRRDMAPDDTARPARRRCYRCLPQRPAPIPMPPSLR